MLYHRYNSTSYPTTNLLPPSLLYLIFLSPILPTTVPLYYEYLVYAPSLSYIVAEHIILGYSFTILLAARNS